MIHNILSFDFAAVILDIMLLSLTIDRKSLKLKHNSVYLVLVFFALISAAASLTGNMHYYISAGPLNSRGFLTVVDYLYYLPHITCGFVMALYCIFLLDLKPQKLQTIILLTLPYNIAVILTISNPLTYALFYEDEALYTHRGWLMSLYYIVFVIYVVLTYLLSALYSRVLTVDKRISMFVMPTCPIIANIVQFFDSRIVIENLAISSALIVAFILFENPDEYLDDLTGLKNANAFFIRYGNILKTGRKAFIVLTHVTDLETWDKETGDKVMNKVLNDIGVFISRQNKDMDVFAIERGLFAEVITSPDDIYMKKAAASAADSIKERFSSPFAIDRYSMTLHYQNILLSIPEDVKNEQLMHEIINITESNGISLSENYYTIKNLDINGIARKELIRRKLESAERDDSVYIYYHPEKTESEGYTALYAEAFLKVPELGMVSGNEFISLAQKYGYTGMLRRYILNKLFKEISEYNFSSYGIDTVEFKLPVSEILRDNEGELLFRYAKRYHLNADLIQFMFSMDLQVDSGREISSKIVEIEKYGFRFGLENYGNGYTNSSAVASIPFCMVTIDHRLTEAAMTSPVADKMVRTVIKSLRIFGFMIKAEHIETKSEEDYAIEIGSDLLQGYYYSRPLDGLSMIKFLKDGNSNV